MLISILPVAATHSPPHIIWTDKPIINEEKKEENFSLTLTDDVQTSNYNGPLVIWEFFDVPTKELSDSKTNITHILLTSV
jgi:hypothetical protein